jgi:hypothetical protein
MNEPSLLKNPKNSNSSKSPKLNSQLLARLKLGVKPKLHWDAPYRVADNPQNNQQKKLEVLEFFRTPSTPEEVWHRLPPERQNKEEFAKNLEKAIAFKLLQEELKLPEFDKPIFIISAPRAGSTLLFETLSQFPNLWTVGRESHDLIEAIPELHPAAHNFSSNRLTEADALPHIGPALRDGFVRQLRDRSGTAYLNLPIEQRPQKIRFLEKTPKNALRVPFLKAIFPDALFIFLYREPRANISSIMEGWRSPHFIPYPELPGWQKKKWRFLLIPGWSSLQNCSQAEIAARQWQTANSYIWNDLQSLPSSSWRPVRYRDLIEEPEKAIKQISEFAGIELDAKIEERLSKSLPISAVTLSAPSPEKWRKNEREILEILPIVEPIANIIERKLNDRTFA